MSAENNGGSNASKLCPLWHNLEIDVFRMLFYVVVAHRRWFSFFSFFFSFRWLMHSLVPSLITAIDWCSLRASSVVVVAMNEVFSVRHGLFNSDNCSVGLETILVCVCVSLRSPFYPSFDCSNYLIYDCEHGEHHSQESSILFFVVVFRRSTEDMASEVWRLSNIANNLCYIDLGQRVKAALYFQCNNFFFNWFIEHIAVLFIGIISRPQTPLLERILINEKWSTVCPSTPNVFWYDARMTWNAGPTIR